MSVNVKADDLLMYAAKTLKGNLQIEQIWKNPNSSVAFSDQTITLDMSDYDFIAIFSVPQNSITVMKRETGIATYAIGAGYPTGGIWTYYRSAVMRGTGINFRDAYSVNYQNVTSTDNKAMIPDTIYGIKVVGGGNRIKRIFSYLRKVVRV